MSAQKQLPTSFRFTAEDLARIDELAHLVYVRMGGRVTVSRKAALLVAIDTALADERVLAERRAQSG